MSYLLIHHNVRDFDTWKKAYDDHRDARDQAGLKELHLLRNHADRNDIVILFVAENLERARAFARSDNLRSAMQQAGVVGAPVLLELE
jgi:heme-degrading monooxygenase HmoA